MASTYIRARKGSACPVCGAEKACSWTRDKALLICTLVGRKGDVLPPPHGYKNIGLAKSNPEGVMYLAEGAERPDAAAVAAERKKDEDNKARQKIRAILTWFGCGGDEERAKVPELAAKLHKYEKPDDWLGSDGRSGVGGHEAIAGYLNARGIDVARLPGGIVPAALRFHDRCFERKQAVDHAGQRTRYEQVTHPAMVAAVVDRERKISGVHRTFIVQKNGVWGKRPEELGTARMMLSKCTGRAVRLCEDFSSGVLVLAEGIETALAVQQALTVDGGAKLGAVWSCLDKDKLCEVELPEGVVGADGPVKVILIAEDCDKSGVGQKAAGIAVNALKAAWPHLHVGVMRLTHQVAPELVETKKGEPRPAAGAKGVDWNDVLVKVGEEAIRGAFEKAISDCGSRISDLGSAIGDPRSAISPAPPTPPTGLALGTRADFDSLGGGGAGSDDGDEGGGDDGGGGTPWVTASEDEMPVIEEGALTRARRWLWTHARCGKGHGRFKLARWAGKWWAYRDGAYSEIDEEGLRSVLWHWLDGFRVQQGRRVLALDPTSRTVEQVMAALAIDTAVQAVTLPEWLAPVIDAAGKPMWGSSSDWGAGTRKKPVRRDPRSLISFPNGVLDLARVVDRSLTIEERLRLLPHSPDLFTTTCLPYDLPRAELEQLVRGVADRDAIYERLCPKFWRWMHDASDGDEGWPWQLQEMLGDTIGLDRSIEKIFGVVGLQRGGKGIIEEAVTHVVGEKNVGAIDSLSLSDRFGLAHLVGCSVAVMPDAHIDGAAAGPGVVERLKAISGQGRIPIRDLYSKAQTHKLTCRIWIFMNTEPELKDESAALAGRFIWLPIVKGYLGKEDATIKASIPAEAPGIMLLALEGAMRLWSKARRAIDVCGAGEEIGAEFAEASAPLQKFVGEWLEFVPRDEGALYVTPDELYQAYECFAREDEKREPLGFRKFIRAVKWLMRPYAYSQPRSDDGARVRRIAGWLIKADRQTQFAEWRNRGQAGKPQQGGWWQKH